MTKKRIFTGLQPTNKLHIGNYFGSIKQLVKYSNNSNYEIIIFIADLHGFTMKKKTDNEVYESLAMYLACGIDPTKVIIFRQSDIKAHTELFWYLCCETSLGPLQRMHQFKDKSDKKGEMTLGLMAYPVLMVADIMLYNPHYVPVGYDQKQHMELCRDIIKNINNQLSAPDVLKPNVLFNIPENLPNDFMNIRSLRDVNNKMSKSDDDICTLFLNDTKEIIHHKIKKALSDEYPMPNVNDYQELSTKRPAIYNLLNIYCAVTNNNMEQSIEIFSNKSIGLFKTTLAQEIESFISPVRIKYNNYINKHDVLKDILLNGQDRAEIIANKNLDTIKSIFFNNTFEQPLNIA